MKVVKYPQRTSWPELIRRPAIDNKILRNLVIEIIEAVKTDGDDALRQFSWKYDNVRLKEIEIQRDELASVPNEVDDDLRKAIEIARANITKFHSSQFEGIEKVETTPGVICWRKSVPIESVGLYIPGGSAPLFSTVLMLGIPARLAGCPEIILCTPPNKDGRIHPVILYTAQILGIERIFKIGGAHAIAAMAYGTQSVPRVAKIFGPGNQYVTIAKQIVSAQGVAIDMPAGPSEVAVVADRFANPDFVAADLLSQAEHGADSQVICVTDNEELIPKIIAAVEQQLSELPRRTIAEKSLESSRLILVNNLDEALEFINCYAPEHLILQTQNPEQWADKVINAGSVFLGEFTPESAGDYASGTNHTLPTNGYARNYSGISVDSFVKKITFQKISPAGLKAIAPAIDCMATTEKLQAHRNAVRIRLEAIEKGAGRG
ncbi:MAG TPA: histidinol dehydrogenase [Candidatus Marinimicrobia bacterium]|nr:histidinol dehydrogenase [Candidatus Neomarinimicrobiota bacterium]